MLLLKRSQMGGRISQQKLNQVELNKTLIMQNNKNITVTFAAFEISCTGPAGDHQGDAMGVFELLIGEERGECPVYIQAHSRQMQETDKTLLFR